MITVTLAALIILFFGSTIMGARDAKLLNCLGFLGMTIMAIASLITLFYPPIDMSLIVVTLAVSTLLCLFSTWQLGSIGDHNGGVMLALIIAGMCLDSIIKLTSLP